MKSVSFLRNTWKKWESKASDSRSNADNVATREFQKPSYSRSSSTTSRPLTVTVQHLPLEVSNPISVDGAWRSSEDEDWKIPPSSICDQFTHQCEHTLVQKDSPRYALNVTYNTHGADSPKSAKFQPITLQHTSMQGAVRVNQHPAPDNISHDKEGRASGPRYLSVPRQRSPSPRSPPLPTYQLLPPIDLNYGPGSKFEKSLEPNACNCSQSNPQSKHHSRCPRYTFSDSQQNVVASDAQTSQKTVHAVLDLSVDSRPRSLYQRSGSTPHLPYSDARKSKSPPSEHSIYSTDGSEADQFPLSLFPAPPPLIVRKKIPTPLVLRPLRHTCSSLSSRDSTPVGTPTTPRFQAINSPTQSSMTSPTKKHFSLRPSASFSPPPFSPPNSPLPSLPTTPDSRRPSEQRRSSDHSARPLRNAQSNANLRDALPFPATHRLTTSEPISDQSNSPTKRPAVKPRPRPETVRVKDIQAYTEFKEQHMSSSNSTDAHVQWGYAL